MPFFNNILKADTWSIAADFNHIAHPLSEPSGIQIDHKEPPLGDRIGGSILFAFSMLLVLPACLYLYWASKKVDRIAELNPGSSAERTDRAAQKTEILGQIHTVHTVHTYTYQEQDDKKGKKPNPPKTPLANEVPAPANPATQNAPLKPPSFQASKNEMLDISSFTIPEKVQKSLGELFGNDRLVERAPFYMIPEGNENFLKPSSFDFPVMKGQRDKEGLRPFIAIKVIPEDPEAYFEKYDKTKCLAYAKDIVATHKKTLNEMQKIGIIYQALKKNLFKEIPTAEENRYLYKEALQIAEALEENDQETSIDDIYAALREEALKTLINMITIDDPETYFEEYQKEDYLKIAIDIAGMLKERKIPEGEKNVPEEYEKLKQEALKIILEGQIVIFSRYRVDPNSLSWSEEKGVWGGETPGFIQYNTEAAIFAQSMLTYKNTGEVIKEAKECAGSLQKLIATGSAIDAHGNAWKIPDFEKVQKLLKP